MKISIIVPVFNRIDFIDCCLQSILNQRNSEFELIIVEDGSTDGTREAVQKYADDPRVKIHLNAQNLGLCASRNAGVAVSEGEYIAYTDSDCIVDPEWITELVKPFEQDARIMITGGQILDPEPKNYWERVNLGSCFLAPASAYIPRIVGCNMAFRRSFLEKNLFDTNLRYAGDELDLCYTCAEQGYAVYYVHAAKVIHHHRSNLKSSFLQQYRYRYENNYTYHKHHKVLYRIPYPLWWLPVILLTLLVEWAWMINVYGVRHPYNLLPALGMSWGIWLLHSAMKRRKLNWIDVMICFPGYLLIILARGLGWARYSFDKIVRKKVSLLKDSG